MAALSKQFDIIEHAVPDGMHYDKWPNSAMRRLAVLDPSEPVKEVGGSRFSSKEMAMRDYFSPKITYGYGANGRPLKVPRVERNPNVTEPHTVAFLDYVPPERPEGSVSIGFINSRQHGHHHAERLIQSLVERYPNAGVHFGKVQNKYIWSLGDKLIEQGHTVTRGRNF